MFTEIDTVTMDEPAANGPALKPWRAKKRIRGKPVNKADGSCDTRAEWVSHIRRIRDAQDQAAFAELFQHFAPRIKAFLIKSGSDVTLAEECAQEVMATLWHKAHLFDPTRATVATWVFTIARNKRIDVLRKQRRPEPENLGWGPEAEPGQDDIVALQQETAQLRNAMAALPDAQRQLIEKAYFGDLSHREIASQTGLPLGTIKSRIRLALDRLRHAMN
ncbi:sigma-70 family RNA polymerase sigma factor [Ruegeria halocynthiae]|uniref:sigma-70 family RNA polymerase sigma factor n=1 Tax=Ruegeria halocynthiae TaxID=985054 RepID=UPI0005678EA5|nr:sigma-70 family RNA polymerase sigma factor [Ruegeria halocynthiae]